MTDTDTPTVRAIVKAHMNTSVETLLRGIEGVTDVTVDDHGEQPIGIDMYQFAVTLTTESGAITAEEIRSRIDDVGELWVVTDPSQVPTEIRVADPRAYVAEPA